MSIATLHRAPISRDLARFVTDVGSVGPVRVVGGRTSWDVGRRAIADARDVKAPDTVIDVLSDELIVRCGAGTPVTDLDAALSSARLQCPLDPIDAMRSTVGGVLSVGRSGVRRLRHGNVRDLLLEAQYVSADGTLRRAGAPVVKNVTGFDICRLLVGSIGTIAAIGEVVLRCQPAPDVRTWFVAEGIDPWLLRRTLFRPSSILWDGMHTYIHLEGSAAEVHAERAVFPRANWTETDRPAMSNGRAVLSLDEQRAIRTSQDASILGDRFLVEIGVGVVHGWDRPLTPPAAEVLAMNRQVKDAFDPTGRMNPGVLPW